MALLLIIVTPEGEAYSGTVEQVVLPGSEGEFGVLERHEHFLAPLRHGALEIRTGSGSEWLAVSKGFADVSGEKIVVLADSCVRAADIDLAKVQAEIREAEAERESLRGRESQAARQDALTERIEALAAQVDAAQHL